MAVAETPLQVAERPAGDQDDAVPGGRKWRGKLGIWLPGGAIVLIVAACFLGPALFGLPRPVGGNVLESYLPAGSPGHLLGTDPNGNDILSRLLHGGRASLFIAATVNVVFRGVVYASLFAVGGLLAWMDRTFTPKSLL